MTEKPIIFSGEMVRAILAGRKTQTRRVMPQCLEVSHGVFTPVEDFIKDFDATRFCPYKADRLWVRETWRETGVQKKPYAYKADEIKLCLVGEDGSVIEPRYKWRPSIHMPRSAARLFLRVTGVRWERLNDISYNDVLAEGVADHPANATQKLFSEYWDKLNAKRGYGWATNPLVWVIYFERVGAL